MGLINSFKARIGFDNKKVSSYSTEDIDKSIKTPKGLEKDDISSGVNMYAGYEHKHEDHLPKLRSQEQRSRLFRMMSTDSSVAGSLRMYEQMFRMATIYTECAVPLAYASSEESESEYPSDWDEKEAYRYSKFLKENLNDMACSTDDIISGAADFLVHGHAIQVPVYKFRDGLKQKSPKRKSKYDDGLVGWQTFKSIDPNSVESWDIPQGEGYSSCKGFQQETISGYRTYVSRDRYIHYRTTAKNDSPTGQSVLLGALTEYEDKCRYKNIEKIGIERDLSGIPDIKCPSTYLSADATQAQKNVVAYLRKIGSHLHFNSQSYILAPSDRDENGNLLIEVGLLKAGDNSKTDAARNVIEALERLIAETMISAWLKLGSSSGSYALSEDLTTMFLMALRGWLDAIIDSFNRDAVDTLFELNSAEFPEPKYFPRINYTGLDKNDIAETVTALMNAVTAGLVTPSSEVQSEILKRMDLPENESTRLFKKQQAALDKMTEAAVEQAVNPPAPAAGTAGSASPSSGGNSVSNITGA